MGRVEGKVAIVTGGAMGIGAAICQLLAREGASVVVTDINDRVGEKTTAAINEACADSKEAGGRAMYCHQDVTEQASWQKIMELAIKEFGRVDILVNNAGTGAYVNIEEETLEGWQRTVNINMDSVFMGTKAAIASMKEQGGSIINISSIMGLVGDGEVPAYNAAKAGVRNFTKSAALHCAKSGYKIRVNSVHPGYIRTPLIESLVSNGEEGAALEQHLLDLHPVGHLGEADDIAYGVLYLASEEAKFVTGTELVIDGGYTAQ